MSRPETMFRKGVKAPPLIFACSPRPDGNSDTAARVFASGIEEAGGTSTIFYLRDRLILPCTGCLSCNPSGQCILAPRDDVQSLFSALCGAPFVCFAAPVYFYHVPALFKGFIDRAQSYYVRFENQDTSFVPLPFRRAYVALCAGRTRGENLFTGSLLSLKYFLQVFGFSLYAPQLFQGMDGPGDFAADRQALNRMRSLGREAWNHFNQEG